MTRRPHSRKRGSEREAAKRYGTPEPPWDRAAFRFPEFHVHHIDLVIECAVGWVVVFVVYPVMSRLPERLSWLRYTVTVILAAVFLWVSGRFFVGVVWGDLQNIRIRRAWLRSYPRVIDGSELKRLSEAAPGRYRLHVKGYGAFDWSRPDPTYLLEDRETKEVLPVHVRSGSASALCEAAGVKVIGH